MCEKFERYCEEREKKGESKTRIENAKKMIASGRLSFEDISIFSDFLFLRSKSLPANLDIEIEGFPALAYAMYSRKR